MARATLLCLAVLLCVAGCQRGGSEKPKDQPAGAPAGPAPMARLTQVKGAVEVTSRGETAVAKEDHRLFLRDRVKAGASTSALLLFLEAARIRVRENTQVVVLSNGLRVQRGDTWFNVVKRDAEFVVEVPGAVLAVLGTSFGVRVGDTGETMVHVEEGKVEVRTREGKSPLEAGGKVTVNAYGKVYYKGMDLRGIRDGELQGDKDRYKETPGGMGSGGATKRGAGDAGN